MPVACKIQIIGKKTAPKFETHGKPSEVFAFKTVT
jgi:hypothetical protein